MMLGMKGRSVWQMGEIVLDCQKITLVYDVLHSGTVGQTAMTPEEKARQIIDAQLNRCGWVVQTKNNINLSAARGVAVCELSFTTRSEEHTSELQSLRHLVCRLL